MKSVVLMTILASPLWVPTSSSIATRPREAAPAHVVVMRIESFSRDSVRVHLSSKPFGLQVRGDTGIFPKGELTVSTPIDISVGAQVTELELSTLDNKAVRVQFTDGATDLEKRLHPWGRALSFKRDRDGNLQPETKVIPLW